jgi:hypothetical protein
VYQVPGSKPGICCEELLCQVKTGPTGGDTAGTGNRPYPAVLARKLLEGQAGTYSSASVLAGWTAHHVGLVAVHLDGSVGSDHERR